LDVHTVGRTIILKTELGIYAIEILIGLSNRQSSSAWDGFVAEDLLLRASLAPMWARSERLLMLGSSTGSMTSAHSHGVRGCSQTRVNGMNPSKEDKGNQDEKHDRADGEEPRLVPADLDIDEGDEAKHEETDLPPAMPPKV
jgi:hypothetical protein